jgi:hypothetical protein
MNSRSFPFALALALLGAVHSAGAQAPDTAAPVEDATNAEAKARFDRGLTLAKEGNCGAAVVELEASYALVARPNTLYNIAQCQEQLFRYDLAVGAYERFLREAPADDPDRTSVEGAMRTLRNLLGTVDVASNTEADVWLGDRIVGRAPGKVLVPGGSHALELRAVGWIPARKQVTVAGQQTVALTINLEKAEQTFQTTVQNKYEVTKIEKDRGISPVFFFVGAGAAVACGVAGTIFGLGAQAKKNEAEDVDPRLSRESYVSSIENKAMTADIFFISAGVLAAGSVVLFFLTDWEGEEEKPPTATTLRVSPVFGAHSAGLSVGGAL